MWHPGFRHHAIIIRILFFRFKYLIPYNDQGQTTCRLPRNVADLGTVTLTTDKWC